MAYGIFYPSVSADDGTVYGTTLSDDGTYLYIGNDGDNNNIFVRFVNVTIPNNSVILKAFIRFRCGYTQVGATCNANIYFNDIGNAVAPTTYSEFTALDLTSVSDSWSTIQSMTSGEYYDTDDCKDSLQEVVSRSDWYSNGAVMALIYDNSSSSGAYRMLSPIDVYDGDYAPELHVYYDDGQDLEIYDENDSELLSSIVFPEQNGRLGDEREIHLWNNKDGTRDNRIENLIMSAANNDKAFSGGTNLDGQEMVDEKWLASKSNGVVGGTGILDDKQLKFHDIGGSFSDNTKYNGLGDIPPERGRIIYLRQNIPESIDTGKNAFANLAFEYSLKRFDSYGKYFDFQISSSYFPEKLDNIVVPVKLSSSSGITSRDMTQIFTYLGSNSKRIAISLGDYVTECPIEIVEWNTSTNEAYLYFKLPYPQVNRTNYFRCYIGTDLTSDNPNVNTAGSATSVWSEDFTAVWNMAQDPNGNPASGIFDSTSNDHDGTPYFFGSGQHVSGLFGKAIDFDGSTNGIVVPDSDDWVLGNDDFTITTVFYMDTGASIMNLLAQRDGTNDKQYFVLNLGGSGNYQANFFTGGVATYPFGGLIGTFSTGTWYVVDMTRSGTNWNLYVNNSLIKNSTSSVNIGQIVSDLYIGTYSILSQPFDGKINSMWIQSEERSSAWRSFVYNGLIDNLISYSPIVTR